jgi:hypothetical protein
MIISRREILKAASAGVAAPLLVGRTARGSLVLSEHEYGGFLVEKITNGSVVYEYDPAVLGPMSQKLTVFSRNVWDPARQNRPGLTERRSV